MNKGIARTLRNNPEEFFFLHNGITAICSSFKIADGTMSVKELNVVNGCQSLSMIFNCSESVRNVSDAYIMFRFYEISNAERADEISTCTNSQSTVKARDLRSNDKYVLLMKKAYEQHFTDGYFITKRGEIASSSSTMGAKIAPGRSYAGLRRRTGITLASRRAGTADIRTPYLPA